MGDERLVIVTTDDDDGSVLSFNDKVHTTVGGGLVSLQTIYEQEHWHNPGGNPFAKEETRNALAYELNDKGI